MASYWTDKLAVRVQGEPSRVINDILKLTQRPEIISFAGGLPAAEFFPRERILEATRKIMESDQAFAALQYGIPEGLIPLREMIARQANAVGIPADVDNILITSGSQQSLDLSGKVFIDPGDRIIVENPTYLGILQSWKMYQADFVPVQADELGIIPEELEKALKAGPAKLIYLVVNFQNPTGITMTIERRREVVRLARKYGVPIVEDDPYGALRYDGEPVESLIAIDAQEAGMRAGSALADGNVISMGSFSKTLCPGFRVAWATAPSEVMHRLCDAKEAGDLHTSTFCQAVLYQTATDGFIEAHIDALRKVYHERRDLMLNLIEDIFPDGVTYKKPEGGLFLWMSLPDGSDSTEMLKEAINNGVAFVPGAPFYPGGGGETKMRLNFSNATNDQIFGGIKRLAGVLERAYTKKAV